MSRYSLLKGIRVLDLSQALAGPFGSQILADLGAEVIKIEPPGTGDITRETVPQLQNDGYYFLALNRNKKSLTLDLQTDSGKRAFVSLVKISDVVYDNMRAKARVHLGITYEQLREINPSIITCSITGFGSSGPYRERSAFDDVVQALGGTSSLTTDKCGVPIRTAVGTADISAAMFAVIGVITALYRRKEKGEGMKIEVNLLDSSIAFMPQLFQLYFITGNLPPRMGTKHSTIATFGFFRTKDGYIGLGPCWPRITRVIDKEELIDDPRFKHPAARSLHKDQLNAEIEAFFSQMETADILNMLHAEDIPAAPVQNLRQVESDPQVSHNKMIMKMRDPAHGEIKVIDCPLKMSESAEEQHLPPPILGQHTDEVLRELLKYSGEEIAEIKLEFQKHLKELGEKSVRRRL